MSLKAYKDKDYGRKRREQFKTRYREETGSGKYESRPWTDKEDAIIMMREKTDRELSSELRRSASSIQKRRWKIKHHLKDKY